MSTDILARLSVNTADFSAKVGGALETLDSRIKANAADIENSYSAKFRSLAGTAKREFAEAFRDVNRLTSEAVGRGASGGAAFDASGAKLAAAASRERVAALEQFVAAATRAVAADASMTAETQTLLAAGRAQLVQESQTASALENKARALELVTAQMNGTVGAQTRVTRSAGQMRVGAQQLGFQINDVAAQMAVGTSATTIFAQQSSQFIQAIQLMTGETRGFLGVLAGPWGIALGVATTLLAGLYAAHEKSADASKDHEKASRTLEQAIDDLRVAGQREVESLSRGVEWQYAYANALRDSEVSVRNLTIAKLHDAEANLELRRTRSSGGSQASEVAAIGLIEDSGKVRGLETLISQQNVAIKNADQAIRDAGVKLTKSRVEAANSPTGKIDTNLRLATERLTRAQSKGTITQAEAERQLISLTPPHKKAALAIQETEKATRAATSSRQKLAPVTSGEVRGLLEDIGGVNIFGVRSAKHNAEVGGAERSYHLFNQAYDLGLVDKQGRAMTKERIRAELEGKGVIIKELLGPGDKDHNDHFHVAFSKRRGTGEAIADSAGRADDRAAREADRQAEALGRVSDSLKDQAAQLIENARLDGLRTAGLGDQAEREAVIYQLQQKYQDAVAQLPGITQAQTIALEAQLLTVQGLAAAEIDRKQAQQRNETDKRLGEAIQGDIDQESKRFKIQALRAQGLDRQADQEEAIYQIRSRYNDLLAGEPAVAAKLLGITEGQVIAERARVKDLEDVTKRSIGSAEGKRQIQGLADFYERAFSSGGKSIWQDFKSRGRAAVATLLAQWTIGLLNGSTKGLAGLGGLLGGGSSGGLAGSANAAGGSSILSSLLGGGSSGAGSFAAAGPIGVALATSSALNSLVGNDQRVGGSILHTILGPLASLGFAAKKGSATLGYSNGAFGVGAVSGNNGSRIDTAKGGIGSVGDALQQIADALGGEVTGAGSVSLGVRKKNFVVDPTGKNRTKGAGVLSFKTEEEAIRAAISDALSDGVIGAISDASQRILAKSGQKLEKAIEKASLIEAIPKALKSRLDPLGAAIDELNRKWDKTIVALTEGGASVEQIADAQKLYGLELANVRETTKGASQELKDYLAQYKVGANSPYSLGQQRVSAEGDLQKFYDAISAGQAIDNSKFVAASNAANDVVRQIEGGTAGYFAFLDQNKAYTEKAISKIDGATGTGTARDPFAELTAKNTGLAADMLEETNQLLRLIAGNIGGGNINLSGLGGVSFIGAPRSFV